MKKLFLILSIALVLAFPSCDLSSLFEDSEGGVPVEPSPDDDSNTLLGIPSQAKSGEKLIEHDAYTVLYSLDDLSPIWVSWHLDSDDTGGSDRPDDFEPDPMIEEDYQVSESDYTNSGFDRGHLCPNADRNGNSALQAETFYTTNIALQNGKLNQGEWKYLEEEIRSLVRQKDAYEAYIVAGTYGVGGYNEDGDYLESYDKSYLTNEKMKPYTKYIQELSREGEFYNNVEQLDGATSTTAAIISSQCGAEFSSYFMFYNPYNKINKTQRIVCLSDILNKAGYNQIFIGGADKKLFNKGNFLLSHNYDIVEDKDSLILQYPNVINYLNDWGVADKEIFEIAQDKYIQLSNKNKPFNMTILTTATHNIEGVYDSRCKNSTDNTLLNAVECTNDLLKDFINFLKNQPNYKDTLIAIMPDHIQYETNVLDDIITSSEKQPYLILLNSNNPKTIIDKNINHADYAEIILKNLNIKSNATFLNKQENIITKNFIHKIHLAK